MVPDSLKEKNDQEAKDNGLNQKDKLGQVKGILLSLAISFIIWVTIILVIKGVLG